MGGQEKSSCDDAAGNCKQCGHPFEPHVIVAYDVDDFLREARFAVQSRDVLAFTPWILISRALLRT